MVRNFRFHFCADGLHGVPPGGVLNWRHTVYLPAFQTNQTFAIASVSTAVDTVLLIPSKRTQFVASTAVDSLLAISKFSWSRPWLTRLAIGLATATSEPDHRCGGNLALRRTLRPLVAARLTMACYRHALYG